MLTEKTFKLAGASKCQFEISYVKVGDQLIAEFDLDRDGAYTLVSEDGDILGYLSARHWVSVDLESGRNLLHARVTEITEDDGGDLCLKVHVVTGDPGDVYTPPEPERQAEPERQVLHANIVGESYRQDAIFRSRPGEPVRLLHETDNKYDPRAIMVVTPRGEQIGYLPRDGWLTEALIDQERAYAARIAEIHSPSGTRKFAAVVLEVTLG